MVSETPKPRRTAPRMQHGVPSKAAKHIEWEKVSENYVFCGQRLVCFYSSSIHTVFEFILLHLSVCIYNTYYSFFRSSNDQRNTRSNTRKNALKTISMTTMKKIPSKTTMMTMTMRWKMAYIRLTKHHSTLLGTLTNALLWRTSLPRIVGRSSLNRPLSNT